MELYVSPKSSLLVRDIPAEFSFEPDGQLTCRVCNNARILPSSRGVFGSGGVCTQDGVFLDSSAFHEHYPSSLYEYDEKSVIHKNAEAVFLGTWVDVYGHSITDNIKKLWFLNSEQYHDIETEAREAGRELDLVYNYYISRKLPAYICDILKSLGIDAKNLVRVDNVTEYSKVYVPDNSLIMKDGWRFYSNVFKSLILRISNYCLDSIADYSEKVYLSRLSIKDKRDFGESFIEDTFKQNGFTIIYPETLTFAQQVSLYAHCRVMATTEGSISHNAIFCKEGTELIVLRKMDYCNEYQLTINDMKKLKVTYIDAHHSIKTRKPWEGPFFMWRTKYLNSFLGYKSTEHCRWFNAEWYRYLFSFAVSLARPQVRKIKLFITGSFK